MSNSTINYHTVFGSVGYVVLGTPTGVVNLLIAISIAKYSALRERKELILLMALATADAFNLFAYVAAGLVRLYSIFISSNTVLRTTHQCLLYPHVWLWSVFYPLSSLMLIALSCDRLLLVALRQKYIVGFGRKYAWRVVGVCFGFSLGFGLLVLLLAAVLGPQEAWLSHICRPKDVYKSDTFVYRAFLVWYVYSQSFFPFISVVIFLIIGPVYKYHRAKVSSGDESEMTAQAKRQHRMTRSLAISATCTFLLQCVPGRLGYPLWEWGYFTLSWCCWLLILTNPMANIFIYQFGHKEMRTALKSMIACKEMPGDIELWQSNKETSKRLVSRSQRGARVAEDRL